MLSVTRTLGCGVPLPASLLPRSTPVAFRVCSPRPYFRRQNPPEAPLGIDVHVDVVAMGLDQIVGAVLYVRNFCYCEALLSALGEITVGVSGAESSCTLHGIHVLPRPGASSIRMTDLPMRYQCISWCMLLRVLSWRERRAAVLAGRLSVKKSTGAHAIFRSLLGLVKKSARRAGELPAPCQMLIGLTGFARRARRAQWPGSGDLVMLLIGSRRRGPCWLELLEPLRS